MMPADHLIRLVRAPEPGPTPEPEGLRERKKERVRSEIQRQALRLFLERGYELRRMLLEERRVAIERIATIDAALLRLPSKEASEGESTRLRINLGGKLGDGWWMTIEQASLMARMTSVPVHPGPPASTSSVMGRLVAYVREHPGQTVGEISVATSVATNRLAMVSVQSS